MSWYSVVICPCLDAVASETVNENDAGLLVRSNTFIERLFAQYTRQCNIALAEQRGVQQREAPGPLVPFAAKTPWLRKSGITVDQVSTTQLRFAGEDNVGGWMS